MNFIVFNPYSLGLVESLIFVTTLILVELWVFVWNSKTAYSVMNDNVIVLNESMLAIQKIYNPDEIKEVDNIGTEGLSVLFNNGNKIFIYFSNIKNNDVDLLKNYFVKFSNDFATA